MSTNSTVACTSFFEWLSSPRTSTRRSGTSATPTLVSVVENGWAATVASPPVRALNSDDFPALGSPTMLRRSTSCMVGARGRFASMSKRTAKRKARSRRKKANHGKRPNVGRR